MGHGDRESAFLGGGAGNVLVGAGLMGMGYGVPQLEGFRGGCWAAVIAGLGSEFGMWDRGSSAPSGLDRLSGCYPVAKADRLGIRTALPGLGELVVYDVYLRLLFERKFTDGFRGDSEVFWWVERGVERGGVAKERIYEAQLSAVWLVETRRARRPRSQGGRFAGRGAFSGMLECCWHLSNRPEEVCRSGAEVAA